MRLWVPLTTLNSLHLTSSSTAALMVSFTGLNWRSFSAASISDDSSCTCKTTQGQHTSDYLQPIERCVL